MKRKSEIFDALLQVLVNYARSSKEAEAVSKEVCFILLNSCTKHWIGFYASQNSAGRFFPNVLLIGVGNILGLLVMAFSK